MPIYRPVPSLPQGARTRQTATISELSVSVVASPRFEPANLRRAESGEERLALHKNHEGRAQAVRAMRRYGYGTTAHGAKRTSARTPGRPRARSGRVFAGVRLIAAANGLSTTAAAIRPAFLPAPRPLRQAWPSSTLQIHLILRWSMRMVPAMVSRSVTSP